MLEIKRFKLKPDADISGVPETPYMTYVNKDAVRGFCEHLYGGIELNVAFPEDLSGWDDFDYVLVLDDDFGQPYTPFYDYLNGTIESFVFLKKVVNAYNKFMGSLPYLEEVEK